MKSLASLGLAVLMLLASGCAVSPQPPDEPMYISSWDLWTEPDRYDGEYVAVTGQLRERNYLFFEDAVTTNNIRPVIYIRPDYRDMDAPASSVPSTGCEDEMVRVFGRFQKGNQYESMLDGVYRIVYMYKRTVSPLDFICWSNPSADPWHAQIE